MNLDDFRNLNHLNRSSNEGEQALGSFEITWSKEGSTGQKISTTWSKEIRLVGRRFDYTMRSEGDSTARRSRKEVGGQQTAIGKLVVEGEEGRQ